PPAGPPVPSHTVRKRQPGHRQGEPARSSSSKQGLRVEIDRDNGGSRVDQAFRKVDYQLADRIAIEDQVACGDALLGAQCLSRCQYGRPLDASYLDAPN